MKIYILTDDPYHDNELYFGAYSTEEKARDAMTKFVIDPRNNWSPCKILSLDVDIPAAGEAGDLICSIDHFTGKQIGVSK